MTHQEYRTGYSLDYSQSPKLKDNPVHDSSGKSTVDRLNLIGYIIPISKYPSIAVPVVEENESRDRYEIFIDENNESSRYLLSDKSARKVREFKRMPLLRIRHYILGEKPRRFSTTQMRLNRIESFIYFLNYLYFNASICIAELRIIKFVHNLLKYANLRTENRGMLGEFNYKTHRILAESPTVIWVYPAVYEELFLISYLSKKIFTEVGGKQSPFPCVDKHSALSLARLTGSEKLIEVFEELTNKDYKKLEQLEKDIERKNLQAKHRGENLKKFDFSTLKSRIMSRCVKTAESYLPKESSRTSTFETEKDLAVIEWISSQNKKKRARFYQKRRLIGSIGFGVLTSIGTFIALDKVLFNYTFKKINQAAPISAGGNESGVNSNISLPNPSSSNSNTSDRERSSSPSTYIYDDVVEVKKLISVSYSNEQLPGYNPNEGFKSIPPDLSKYKTAGILNKDWIRLGNEYLSFTPKKIIVSSKQYDSLFSVQGHNEKRRVEFKLPGNQKALFLQFSLADLNLENKNNIYNINVYSEDELLWSGKCYGQQIVSLPLSIPDTNRLVIEYSVFGQGNSVSSGIPELHFTRAELLFEL